MNKERLSHKMRFILLFGMIALGISGCKKKDSAPELIPPAAMNSFTSTAEVGNIGLPYVFYGTVVPVEYGMSFSCYEDITEIVVRVGDHVEEGDILAYADVKDAGQKLEELKEQLMLVERRLDIVKRRCEYQIKQLEYSNMSEIERKWKNELLEEELIYVQMDYQAKLTELTDLIGGLQEITEAGVLRATCSGTVTYVRDISEQSAVDAATTVVRIATEGAMQIELEKENIQDFSEYRDSDKIYLMKGDKEYVLSEIPYTADEMTYAVAVGDLPAVRFACPEGLEPTMGESYIVYCSGKVTSNVLRINRFALHTDDGEYVYVVNSEGIREKRPVVTGARDDWYVEIKEGLSVGEKVTYETTEIANTSGSTYVVTRKDHDFMNYTNSYFSTGTRWFTESTSKAGVLADFSEQFVFGGEIHAGDYLYSIQMLSGAAEIAEAKLALKRAQEEYEINLKKIDQQIAAYKGNLSEAKKCELALLQCDREELIINSEAIIRECTKRCEELYFGEDGSNIIPVYAKEDGVISGIFAKEGNFVEANFPMYQLKQQGTGNIMAYLLYDISQEYVPSSIIQDVETMVHIGTVMTVNGANGKNYTGTCIGLGIGVDPVVSLYTDGNGEIHLNVDGKEEYPIPAFVVSMDDPEFGQEMPGGRMFFAKRAMKQVVTVPTAFIHWEQGMSGRAFVWKKVGDEVTKQYVIIDCDLDETVVWFGLEAGDIILGE